MSNMSYCRFHNTHLDLQDCAEALERMRNNTHLASRYDELRVKWKVLDKIEYPSDDQQEEMDSLFEEMENIADEMELLSESEARRAKWLMELCAEIAEVFEEDDLLCEEDYRCHLRY